MADEFLKLLPDERREVINAAAPELDFLARESMLY